MRTLIERFSRRINISKMFTIRQKLLWIITFILVGMLFCLFLERSDSDSDREPLLDPRIPRQMSDDLPGCLAIIHADVRANNTKLYQPLGSARKEHPLSEDFYLNATADCPAYTQERGFITEPLSEEERDFPIAYSMVIHEKIELFERLLRAVYAPQNIYCIHVDRKSPATFHEAVEAIASCFPNVFIATRLESVVYASWSRLQADLNCMRDLVNSHVQWRYLLNTCGSDLPIKTNKEMVSTLKALNGKNNMETKETSKTKKLRWQFQHKVNKSISRTDVEKSPPPISGPMFVGSAYIVVTRAFVRHVLEDKELQGFLEWGKDTYSPDEFMWATLQRMPSVPGSLPPHAMFDTTAMLSFARVVKWSYQAGDIMTGKPYDPCTGTYRRSACVYGTGDLQWLLQQHHLFANKFDPEVDDIAIRCLEAVLRFKALGKDLLLPE